MGEEASLASSFLLAAATCDMPQTSGPYEHGDAPYPSNSNQPPQVTAKTELFPNGRRQTECEWGRGQGLRACQALKGERRQPHLHFEETGLWCGTFDAADS